MSRQELDADDLSELAMLREYLQSCQPRPWVKSDFRRDADRWLRLVDKLRTIHQPNGKP